MFNYLQVTVLGTWQEPDVTGKLQGGIITDNIHDLPSALKDIGCTRAASVQNMRLTLVVMTLDRSRQHERDTQESLDTLLRFMA